MIEDLDTRVNFWSRHYRVPCQGKTNPRPFEVTPSWMSLYMGKKVLEIGPGEGRQSDALMRHAKEYHVADICEDVLIQDRFSECEKHHIGSLKDDFSETFDTICCWYVVHHIKHSELDDFFKFVKRHSYSGTRFHFNYPVPRKRPGGWSDDPSGDGIRTTKWSIEAIKDLLKSNGFDIVHFIERNAVVEAVAHERI